MMVALQLCPGLYDLLLMSIFFFFGAQSPTSLRLSAPNFARTEFIKSGENFWAFPPKKLADQNIKLWAPSFGQLRNLTANTSGMKPDIAERKRALQTAIISAQVHLI